MKAKIIGFGGVARAGKDSAYEALKLAFPEKTFKRYAFADPLKSEIEDIVFTHFGLNVWSLNDEQKKAIRPLLVGWGAGKRYINEDYWLNKVMAEIEHDTTNAIPVITDVRYENEALEILNRGGAVIHLSRIEKTGNMLPPANDEEKANDFKVKKISNLQIIWETFEMGNDYSKLIPFVKNLERYV